MTFRTRFAPSPTGPLHLGHGFSAILAHDMARAAKGQFLVRMEDTDLQRSKPEWEALILTDLAWLGLSWDGPVLRQAEQLESYGPALEQLADRGLLYPCSCSRSDIRAALAAPQEGHRPEVYPSTCKARALSSRAPGDAIRLHLDKALAALAPEALRFEETGEAYAGGHVIDADSALAEIGDVVLARKEDGLAAYFLASAIDDARQGISHVIRGEDLFDFTPIQVILLRLLGLPVPIYHHHRLIRDDAGKRLAKRDDARALSTFRDDGFSPDDIRVMVGLKPRET